MPDDIIAEQKDTLREETLATKASALALLHEANRAPLVRHTSMVSQVEETPKSTSAMKQVAVGFGELIVRAPEAIASKILEDTTERPVQVGATVGVSALVGFGATTLLRRSPVLTQGALAVLGLAEGARLAYGACDYAFSLGAADSAEEHRAVIEHGVRSVASEGATMIEGLSGMAAGSALSYRVTPRISSLNKLSLQVCQKVDYPVRCMLPDRLHWIGPGTKTLPATLRSIDGNLDVKGISDALAKMHPWRGVEEGRFLRLEDLKLSRAYSGTPESVVMVGDQRMTPKVSFHTHPSEYSVINPRYVSEKVPSGAVPSQVDLHNTNTPFGIISSGSKTTVFMNGRNEFFAKWTPLRGQPEPLEVPLPMRAVMFDREHKVAAIMEGGWKYYPSTKSGSPLVGRAEFLDYDKTLARLANWDMKWSSIREIPTVPPPAENYHLFPKMTKEGHFTWERVD